MLRLCVAACRLPTSVRARARRADRLPSAGRAARDRVGGARLPAAQARRGTTLRGAKCVELFCETFAALVDDALVPPPMPKPRLSERDTRRIVHARLVIDEQWREKLTLDAIARTCGVNRAKLTRGFRALFGVTIADAIAERRLGGARQMLLATDLPVSSVGYACGYQNNASFTRAFSRRFGVVPTRLRAAGLAA